MNKKLEIGDKIVIYPEKGHCYTSLETKNGIENRYFNSSNFYETLIAVFIGRKKGKDGKWYEKYTLEYIPDELYGFELYGKRGFENSIEELDAISQILQGKAEDGRKILYSRSINIEDVNEILGVVVDYKNKIVYQKNNPAKDINELKNFGLRRKIHPSEAEICSTIKYEFIKENQLESTAYCYNIALLEISEKRKETVSGQYYLASRSVTVNEYNACFELGYVCGGSVEAYDLFVSNGNEDSWFSGVCPVFYLESNIQNEVIEEQQEEKVLTEYNNKVETKKGKKSKEVQEIKALEYLKEIKKQEEKITKLQESLSKEEKKLEEMMEEALKLV